MGSFYNFKCQWPNCSMKAEALDELLSHVENIHIPKERLHFEDQERRLTEQLPMSCIFSYSSGPVQLRYKRSRSHQDKSVRDNFSSRERECTQEQLQDRFNFDEDDFATHQTPINEEHLMKLDIVTQDQRRIKTGILKANARAQESHKCHCGKSYRSSNALRNHMMTYHAARGSQIAADDS